MGPGGWVFYAGAPCLDQPHQLPSTSHQRWLVRDFRTLLPANTRTHVPIVVVTVHFVAPPG